MQSQIPASRLVAVANGISEIAPLLWGGFQAESIEVLSLKDPDEITRRSSASV